MPGYKNSGTISDNNDGDEARLTGEWYVVVFTSPIRKSERQESSVHFVSAGAAFSRVFHSYEVVSRTDFAVGLNGHRTA